MRHFIDILYAMYTYDYMRIIKQVYDTYQDDLLEYYITVYEDWMLFVNFKQEITYNNETTSRVHIN